MRPALTLLVAGTLALAGCASARPAGAPDPAQPAPATLTPAALALITHGGSFAADEVLLHRADETLIARCMAGRGERYVSPPYTPAAATSLSDDDEHPDVAWRRTVGYSLRLTAAGPPRDGNDAYLATLSEADQERWSAALKGDGTRMTSFHSPSGHTFTSPLDGCIADSGRWLYGSPEQANRGYYLPQDLRLMFSPKIRAEPAYRAAAARWSACMQGRGYRYTGPGEARTELSRQYDRGPADVVQRAEVAVALADAQCVTAAGLTTATDRLTRQHTAVLAADARRQLNAAAADRAAALGRARALLAGSAVQG